MPQQPTRPDDLSKRKRRQIRKGQRTVARNARILARLDDEGVLYEARYQHLIATACTERNTK